MSKYALGHPCAAAIERLIGPQACAHDPESDRTHGHDA
jgi:hypothetical protein